MTQSVLTPFTLFTPANFINGRWFTEGDGTFCSVVDKYHGTTLARIPHATDAQMEEAMAAAYASRDALWAMSAGERSAKLEALESGSYSEEDWDVIPVEAVRLDDAVNAAELCHPILVKMDVQGAESSAIAGGPQLFAAADYVIMEFWPYGMKRLGADPQAMIDLVGSFPYAAFLSDSSTARPELGSAAVVAEELSRSLLGESPARFYRDVFLARGALPAD